MGIPVLSEIELAYVVMKAPIIGVTGTNGKTTTTMLIAEILKETRNSQVLAAGNIGVPLGDVADEAGSAGIVVAELSSFQLLDIDKFRPQVAVFINFDEDHLDYHGSLENYFRAKSNILRNQTASDYTVLNGDNEKIASLAGGVKGNLIRFRRGVLEQGFGIKDDRLVLFHSTGCSKSVIFRDCTLPGSIIWKTPWLRRRRLGCRGGFAGDSKGAAAVFWGGTPPGAGSLFGRGKIYK